MRRHDNRDPGYTNMLQRMKVNESTWAGMELGKQNGDEASARVRNPRNPTAAPRRAAPHARPHDRTAARPHERHRRTTAACPHGRTAGTTADNATRDAHDHGVPRHRATPGFWRGSQAPFGKADGRRGGEARQSLLGRKVERPGALCTQPSASQLPSSTMTLRNKPISSSSSRMSRCTSRTSRRKCSTFSALHSTNLGQRWAGATCA